MTTYWHKGAALLLVVLMLVVTACGGGDAPEEPADTEAQEEEGEAATSDDTVKVGFLYVGPVDDFGYNQAAEQGRQVMEEMLDGEVETVFAENVPEDANAERVMEQMIRDGAEVIFPTSYGHFGPAVNVSESYPDVAFFHQGGLEPEAGVSSFFGEIWQMVYASGVAAGHMTETDELGYIVAFPIPQVLLNVNAFHLGASSVNPDVTTTVVFTANWCDPGQLSEAANSLIDQGVDVVTQHQDCTKPIVETAEERGVMSVGYHADASSIAPNGWITGAIWEWGPLYADLTEQAINGEFEPELIRLGTEAGVVELAPFGENVPEEVQEDVLAVRDAIIAGELKPFTGPIIDQNGEVRIEGAQPDTVELEQMDYLVEGVVGTIPE
jgi:basic membrane lipoprotein Med (substrate-binding protein (PBP1-ABC) superfamily)